MQDTRGAVPSNDLIRVDRRRYPRLHLVGEFDGRAISFQLDVRVLDISADGFAIQSPFEFTPGTAHEFQCATLRQPRPVVRAVAVHSRRVTPQRGRDFFVAGFSFVDLSSASRDAIYDIVADVGWFISPKPAVVVPAAELTGVETPIKYK